MTTAHNLKTPGRERRGRLPQPRGIEARGRGPRGRGQLHWWSPPGRPTTYEYEVTEPYELPLERNAGIRPGSCCRGVESVDDLCLECHLAVFA